MRFFSPPEKPTLSGALAACPSMFELRRGRVDAPMRSGVVSSSSPRALRCALSAALRKVIVATPGISSGYWKARNRPAAARSSGSISSRFAAVEQASRRRGSRILLPAMT